METENKPEGGGLPPEIERAALMFVAGPLSLPDTLRYPHTRDGLLVATDGRALLRVEDPRIVATPGGKASILDFAPEDGDVLIGAREKIDALRARVYEAWGEEAARIDRLEEEFDEDTRANTQACPCCGAMIYVDSFRDLVDLDDRERDRPDDRSSSRYVRVCTASREDAFSLYDLRRMFDAAKVLGGADELRLGQRELQLRGANWIALCIDMRGMPPRSEIAFDLDFREVRT